MKYTKICLLCKKRFKVWNYLKNSRKYCSMKCSSAIVKKHLRSDNWLGKKRPDVTGANQWKWKGDKVGYDALHAWVKRQKGKGEFCVFDPSHVSRYYDWANISGSYLRNVDDFVSLCRKCHKQYDMIRSGKVYL